MRHPLNSLLALLLTAAVGCASKDDSAAGDSAAYGCAGDGDVELVIGENLVGGQFVTMTTGAIVGVAAAPQGGFGVFVSARTTGLVSDNPVDVLLEVEVEGALLGTYLSEGVQLYCQEDGSGLLWGVAVGFDSKIFQTTTDLLDLDGQQIDLLVSATDVDGETASDQITVELAL
jgi:hypothetical protein